MKNYTVSCQDWNSRHARFHVFDSVGANCGTLNILTDDVVNFLQNSWKGNIAWNNKIPDVVMAFESPYHTEAKGKHE